MSHRFFWFLDAIVLGISFLVSYFLFPGIQSIFAPGGPLEWVGKRFLPPPESWGGQLTPMIDFLWIFLIISIAAIIVLEFIGGHNSLSSQSRTRIIFNSFLSPLVGMSLVTLILFALKSQIWSRLFIFSFTVLSALGLCLYLLMLRRYFRYRRA